MLLELRELCELATNLPERAGLNPQAKRAWCGAEALCASHLPLFVKLCPTVRKLLVRLFHRVVADVRLHDCSSSRGARLPLLLLVVQSLLHLAQTRLQALALGHLLLYPTALSLQLSLQFEAFSFQQSATLLRCFGCSAR